VLPKDAREATDFFVKRNQGDVLLNWETEAILAKKKGEWSVPYKVFSPNILTEQPVAVVDKVVDRRGTRKVAEAFVRYLYTPTAQKIFVDNGFRPVTPEGKAYARGKFPTVNFYKVGDFGGWGAVDLKFYDHPASPFVMRFVGEVNVLETADGTGEAPLFVRPHDLELLDGPNGQSFPATVRRLTTFGRDFQVELELDDGQRLLAQLNREQVKGRLDGLVSGTRTHIQLRGGRRF
jgi:hypothetical protein